MYYVKEGFRRAPFCLCLCSVSNPLPWALCVRGRVPKCKANSKYKLPSMQYKSVLQNTKQLPRQVQKELQLDSLGERQDPAVHQKRQKFNKISLQTMTWEYFWLQNENSTMNIGSLDASPKIHATLLIEYSEGGLQTKVVLGDGTNSISLAGKADVKGADIELLVTSEIQPWLLLCQLVFIYMS